MTHGPAASRKVGDDFMLMDSEGRLLATVRGFRSPVYDRFGTYKRTVTLGWRVVLFEDAGRPGQRVVWLRGDGTFGHYGTQSQMDMRHGFKSLSKAKATAKREAMALSRR